MIRFIKKCFFTAISFFNSNVLSVNSLECVTIKNQDSKTRPRKIHVNSNEPVFYSYSIKVNKCSGSFNSINDPHAKLRVADIVKNINVKVFNLMSRINETRHIIWHKTCKCICRLTASVGNNKQRWNEGKCRCEWKEDLIDKKKCDKGFIWNPSNFECECDKSCGVGQYLD